MLLTPEDDVGQYVEIKDDQQESGAPAAKRPPSLLSRIFFFYFDLFIYKNSKMRRKLQPDEPSNSAKNISCQWEELLAGGSSGSILWMIGRLCTSHIICSSLLEMARLAFTLSGPLILRHLIAYLDQDSQGSLSEGSQLSFLLVATGFVGSICETHIYFQLNKAGIIMKSALITAIYKKSLNMLSPNDADVVNLISVDCANLQKAFRFLHFPWSCPIQIFVSLLCLHQVLQSAVIPGVILFFIMVLVSLLLTLRMKKYQREQLSRKDRRLEKIVETIANLKIIKLHVWERTFRRLVDALRLDELRMQRMFLTAQAFQGFVWNCAVFVIAFVSFSVFAVSQGLDVETAFTSLALLNNLRTCFRLIPTCVTAYSQGSVSIQRIERFLHAPDDFLDQNDLVWPSTQTYSPDQDTHLEAALVLRNCSFARIGSRSGSQTLTDISLTIKKGELVGILGRMGSGKSTLISALSGNLRHTQGDFILTDQILLVPNIPWLKTGTIKENVLFNMDPIQGSKLYEKVIRACGLVDDLQRLPDGDMTLVKKNGDNLSGGQRQRISLARAVYRNASIYLLDDSLSAIDPVLRHKVFHKVIGRSGILRKKTRIFVTSELKFLRQMDYIVVMKNQVITDIGTFDELYRRNVIDKCLEESDDDDQDEETKEASSSISSNNPFRNGRAAVPRLCTLKQFMQTQISMDDDILLPYHGSPIKFATPGATGNNVSSGHLLRRTSSLNLTSSWQKASLSPKSTDGELDGILDEDLCYDKVNLDVYRYYVRTFGLGSVCLVLLTYILCHSLDVAAKLWLSHWANDDAQQLTTATYIAVFGICGFLQSTTYLAGVLLVNERCLNASLRLHRSIFSKVLGCTIDFVWTTPLGQISNRFSKDTDEMDVNLPSVIKSYLYQSMRILGTLFIIIFSFPGIVLGIVPLCLGILIILRLYLHTSRYLRRMSAATMALLNSHTAESVRGAATIRAYKLKAQMTEDCMRAIDQYQTFYRLEVVSDCWLFVRLQMLISVFMTVFTLSTVFYRRSVGTHLVSLSLTSAITIMQDVFLYARYAATLEKSMISIERIREYENIVQEAPGPMAEDEQQVPTKIPDGYQQGGIVFDRVTSRYAVRGDVALRDVSFNVLPGHKIGIVGRTGAGKTSLVMTLFRLLETVEGAILVDEQDIAKKDLFLHRASMTIIPQEVALFAGTLRFNLDPTDNYSDQEIWSCINESGLGEAFKKMAMTAGLETEMKCGGEGLSNGEKQAICCMRGILSNRRLLILDESTCSLGQRMEERMTAAFNRRFCKATILMITHNIEKTLACDRVLVLAGGRVKEFDCPHRLLSDTSSNFYEMARESGLV